MSYGDNNGETRSLADLAAELESARAAHADALRDLEAVKERVKFTSNGAREAYNAFNEAVAAMRPKRKSPTKKGDAE